MGSSGSRASPPHRCAGGGEWFVGEHRSDHMPCAFLRLSQSLQYCGHFIPAWIFPAALSAFHSAPQARSRAIMAWRPAEPVGAGFAVVAGAGAGVVAGDGAAVAGAAVVGADGTAVPAMHCLLKSRYFMPP